jgi:selenocysteine lyase/cysteine desulfurase
MSNFFFTGTAADKIPPFAAINAFFSHPVGVIIVSLVHYNTKEEVNRLVEDLPELLEVF